MIDDAKVIPDERLRLIFVCCHPAVAGDARAALTLRLVCGLTTAEIARAFLVSEAAMFQRIVRAKRKIADAGVPFEIPSPDRWSDRLDAVLSTLEVAYGKAHEDAAGAGVHAGYAGEMLKITWVLAELLPSEPEALALAAMVRFAEARRPARLDEHGAMVPLSEQEPELWQGELILAGEAYQKRAEELGPLRPRVLQAAIHRVWCGRRSLAEPAPWPAILKLYDALLVHRDDPVVRLNRAVAMAEVLGVDEAMKEIELLDGDSLAQFLPYHAVRADLLRRAGRLEESRAAYQTTLALNPAPAERLWLHRREGSLELKLSEPSGCRTSATPESSLRKIYFDDCRFGASSDVSGSAGHGARPNCQGTIAMETGSSIQVRKETVAKLFDEVINTGRLDLCDHYLAADRVDYQDYGLPPGAADGHEGFKRVLGGFCEAFPDLHLEIEFMIVDDDRLMGYVSTTGTHRNSFRSIPATGRSFKVRGVDIFGFNHDGKIAAHWGVFDTFGMMTQLGVIPTPQ